MTPDMFDAPIRRAAWIVAVLLAVVVVGAIVLGFVVGIVAAEARPGCLIEPGPIPVVVDRSTCIEVER